MAKGKGFGTPRASLPDDDAIYVQSMVRSRDLIPAVEIKWGEQHATLDSEQARHHAYATLEAIAAAELDACLMRWAIQKIGLTPQEAARILMLFRQKRDDNALPSVTMSMGNGEHLRPDTVKQRATQLFDAAFGVEIEAFLVEFLTQNLGRSADVADQIIQEFRAMRGLTTVWPEEGQSDET